MNRIHANYPNPNGAFSYGKPNSTLPENAIANILTKSGSLLQVRIPIYAGRGLNEPALREGMAGRLSERRLFERMGLQVRSS